MQQLYITKRGKILGEDYVFYRSRTCGDEGAATYKLSVAVKRQPKPCASHHFIFDIPPKHLQQQESAAAAAAAADSAASAAADSQDPTGDSSSPGSSAAGTCDPSAAAAAAAAELQPLAAEAEALQRLEQEKKKYIIERDRGGWRGWIYAEDNCDLSGFDAVLQLPAALASEIRVLLGLQPSIMAHRCK